MLANPFIQGAATFGIRKKEADLHHSLDMDISHDWRVLYGHVRRTHLHYHDRYGLANCVL
jgi:hypothetical protein